MMKRFSLEEDAAGSVYVLEDGELACVSASDHDFIDAMKFLVNRLNKSTAFISKTRGQWVDSIHADEGKELSEKTKTNNKGEKS